MDTDNVRERVAELIVEHLHRPWLSPEQRLFATIGLVGLLMIMGGIATVSGFVLLILSTLAQSVLGVVLSASSLVGGAAVVFAGYIWFTS